MQQIVVHREHLVMDATKLAERYDDQELAVLAKRAGLFARSMAVVRCICGGPNFLAIMVLGAAFFDQMAKGPAGAFAAFLAGITLLLTFNIVALFTAIHASPVIDLESIRAAIGLRRRAQRKAREEQRAAFGLPVAS
jgi:hypothetical protein